MAFSASMRYAMIALAIAACLTVTGCVTDKVVTAPDHVLDPRGR